MVKSNMKWFNHPNSGTRALKFHYENAGGNPHPNTGEKDEITQQNY